MAKMKLIVFNVEQGRCIYLRTPSDYGILIDCTESSSKSQIEWLEKNEVPSLKLYKGNAITPNIAPIEDSDFGVNVRRFSLSKQEAEQLGGDVQQQANNQSVVTIVSYKSPEDYAWKVVIAGDNETKGWEALLAKPEFSAAVADADFFVTSNYGQDCGFCAELFNTMGKPIANITSTRKDAEPADSKYKKHAQGVKFPDGSRKHFITRGDGNITVEMHDDGNYDVWLFTPSIEEEKK